MPLVHATVTTEVLDLDQLRNMVDSPRAGATLCFVGQIRDHDPEAQGPVASIDYTAHPDAPAMIGPIIEKVLAELDPDGEALVSAEHRIGHLEVGELALVVCVATPHRKLGFRLCDQVVEAIKAELPIWKQQEEVDGRQVWSNLGLDR